MRRFIGYAAFIAALFLSITPAHAYGVWWTGAGWYVVDDNPGGLALFLGPFEGEALCKNEVPPKEEYAVFECNFFGERPSWDHYGLDP